MAFSQESISQTYLFNWAKGMQHIHPELEYMFHIPNGGKRDVKTAKRLKAEGTKSGVPDIFLPVARRGFHGLFIEMKSPKGSTSDNQNEWLEMLSIFGFKTANCRSHYDAIVINMDYLKD
jgi:hypothetical protein